MLRYATPDQSFGCDQRLYHFFGGGIFLWYDIAINIKQTEKRSKGVSIFYESMAINPDLDSQFKEIKRAFKHGQPCKKCGRKLAKHLMTVDHIKDVEDPSVDPFDMTNWQVLCIYCHRDKNREKMRSKHKIALERSDQKR